MSKCWHNLGLCMTLVVSLGISYPIHATDSETLEDIKDYIYNLGFYGGYKASEAPTETSPKSTLLADTGSGSPTDLMTLSQYAFLGFFGATPVNSFFATFVPESDSDVYAALNDWANTTFSAYSTESTTTASVSELIDQKTYQDDPVSQFTLNLFATPNNTYCMNNDASEWLDWSEDCDYMTLEGVMANLMGLDDQSPTAAADLPTADELFSYDDYISEFISQLNPNSLTSTLMFSTSEDSESTSTAGLVGTTQEKQAQNFIRYASGEVLPIDQVDYATYLSARAAATKSVTDSDDAGRTTQRKALAAINKYLLSQRVYAARNAVPISTLYDFLSKRMPQTNLSNKSQAYLENAIATRRQYNPDTEVTQWIDSINNASPATVQKETAILLSDILSELHTIHKVQESLLLTQTIALLDQLSMNKPSPELSEEE